MAVATGIMVISKQHEAAYGDAVRKELIAAWVERVLSGRTREERQKKLKTCPEYFQKDVYLESLNAWNIRKNEIRNNTNTKAKTVTV